LHERSFCHLHLPHLQLDELRTRLRCATQVLWLWLAIDPCTKLLPVLHLGPRTQHMAHRVIHSLRQLLAAFLPPALYERRLKSLLLCAHGPFWTLAPDVSPRAQSPPVAGGGGLDLRPGEKMLPTTQAGSGDPRDASGDPSRSHGRLTEDRSFGTTEHCLHRAGQSHGSSRSSSSGTSNLGNFPTDLTASGSPGVVASLVSRMSRPHESLRVALVQPQERGGNLAAQRYRQRTPAMAAGRPNRRWTARELLACPLPPVSA
jgi:hypothetical protein